MKSRLIIGWLLFGAYAIAQSADDSAMYLKSFQEAAQRPEVAPGQPIRNGVSVTYVDATMEDILGTTSDEAHSLARIGFRCENDVRNLDAGMSALIFESRLELAESNRISDAVASN